MGSRGRHGVSHIDRTLPPNPEFLDFPRTDGDSTKWRNDTKKVVDHEGHVNYHRIIEDDEGASIHWRTQIGQHVAERIGLPPDKNYVFRKWPEGYKFYDHNKGKESAPRHDLYLIGSIHVARFRSIPEFIPHAIWLMQDETMDRSNCFCKYCAGTPQRKVTESLGLRSANPTPSAMRPLRAPPRAPPIPRAKNPRQTPRQPMPHAVRTAPRPIRGRKERTSGPQEPMVSERYADLQVMYSELEMPLRRWHREDELVWFQLHPPIYGHDSTTSNIVFWPGLIQDTIVRSEVVSAGGTNDAQPSGADVEMMDLTQNIPVKHEGTDELVQRQGSKWTVLQSTVYKIKAVGTNHTYHIPDNDVLPYTVYTPSNAVRDALHTVPIDQLPSDPATIQAFEPLPQTAVVDTIPARDARFRMAAAPYWFALEIANNIAKTWTPTDEWTYKPRYSGPRHSTGNTPHPYPSIPPTVPNSPTSGKHNSMSPPTQIPTAQSALLAAALTSRANTSHAFTPPIPSGLSQEDGLVDSASAASPSPGQMPPLQMPQKQTRYQGLWWGAERLWTDELVRLKPSRRQISPFGGTNLLPPSGPSQTNPSNGAGAIDRSIFMLLQALFVADLVRENGEVKKECRASGMLFELADEDYVEQFSFNQPAQPLQQGGPQPRAPASLNTLPRNVLDPSLQHPPIPNPAPTVSISDTSTSIVEAMNVGADPITSIPGPPGHPPDPSTGLESNRAPRRSSSPKKDLSSSSKSDGYYYPLPPPPPGYKFRPILTPGSEVVVPLTFISGRYYPHLFAHPALHHAFDESRNVVKARNFALRAWSAGMGGTNVGVQRVHVPELERLLTMEGLVPEFDTGVYPTKWKGGRSGALKEVEKEAEALLVQAIQGAGPTEHMQM